MAEEHGLLIVGGGRMGEALLGGLLAAGRDPAELAVVEVSAPLRERLGGRYEGVSVLEAPEAVADALLAVKPDVVAVAAGITTRAIEDAAGEGVRVVRAMPNTPALIGAGAAAVCAGSAAGDEDL